MLGDSLILGQKTCAIDGKGRIILPKFIDSVEADEKLLVLKNNNSFIKIYNTEVWHKQLKFIQDQQLLAYETDVIEKWNRKIELILASIIDTIHVDGQRRILLAKELREQYLINGSVFIQGNVDHFRIYESKDTYNDYMKSITR